MSKGGGGDPNAMLSRPITLTDPVNGKTFVQETNPNILAMRQRFGYGPEPSAQDQLNAEIAQRQASETDASNAAKADAAAKAAAAEQDFQTRLTGAGTTARTQATQFLQSQGLDPAKFQPLIDSAITRSTQSVKDLDPNPTGSFDPNLGQSVLNEFTSGGRTRATASINDLFSPTFSQDRLSTSAADPLINDILNEQFNPLNTSLTFARDRGQLTPQGFSAAQDLLSQKRTAAESTVRGLANSTLGTDRKTIDDLITGAKNTAGGLNASQFDTFNPASYRTQADELVNRELGSLGGDIRNAVGQTKFADLNELIGAGGVAQGPTQTPVGSQQGGFGGTDPSDTSAALAEQARRNASNRGLGQQGAF